jgi:hypothetical protein
MLAVVNFPEYQDESLPLEKVEAEVDELFNYMDSRLEEGSDSTDVLAAMIIVIKLITEQQGNLELVH